MSETVLTTGNVNQGQFGKLFSYPVDGYTYAQPLYMASVNVAGQGIHNVVYVATEFDSVYAFDADNLVSTPLWHTSFVNVEEGVTPIPRGDVEGGNDITPWIGITATPVIDPATNTIFVVARTKEVDDHETNYVQRLHALDITTGEERSNSPVVVQAEVSGTGSGSSGGEISFDSLRQNPRPGLLLLNGTVYMAWASLEDLGDFHGWVMGYDENSLQPVVVWNATPNGSEGGIWQGGGGLAADTSGNIFFSTGNGTFDANLGGLDYGDTFVKARNSAGTLAITDYFTPYNQGTLDSLDWDLAAGAVTLLPDQPGPNPHLALVGGKAGTVYLVNRDNLGQFNQSLNQNLLTLPAAIGPVAANGGSRGGAAYWQGQVYYVGSLDSPRQFAMHNGTISTSAVSVSSDFYHYPGGAPTVSANGAADGIVWVLDTGSYAGSKPAVLRAYDAAQVSRELYNSKQNPGRDQAGPAVKFTVPTVANGKVYVPTETELDVYGLLP